MTATPRPDPGRGTIGRMPSQTPTAAGPVIRVRDPQGGYGFYDFDVNYR